MSEIFVLGGTGLIGRRLVQHLIARGHRVTVATRAAMRGGPSHLGGARLVPWDGTGENEEFAAALAAADGVVNLAGAGVMDSRWTPEYMQEIRDSRVAATRAVARGFRPPPLPAPEAAEGEEPEAPPRRPWVNASAVGLYGLSGDLATEETPQGEGFLAETCQAWEAEVDPAPGVRAVVLRLGVVLTGDGGAFPQLTIPYRFGPGGWLGTGGQAFPWVHVDDVVRAIRWALFEDGAEGAYNVVAPGAEEETAKTFATTLSDAYGRSPLLMPPPPVPNLLGAGARLALGERADLILKGRAVSSARIREAGFKFRYGEAGAACAALLAA